MSHIRSTTTGHEGVTARFRRWARVCAHASAATSALGFARKHGTADDWKGSRHYGPALVDLRASCERRYPSAAW